jgi:hypothetical protein
MKGYIVYHYKDNSQEWMDELFMEKRFPVFDFVSDDRVLVLDKHKELGGTDAGYYIAQVSEMVVGG